MKNKELKMYEKIEKFIKIMKVKLNLTINASKLWKDLPGITDKNGDKYQIHYLGLRIRNMKTMNEASGYNVDGYWWSRGRKKLRLGDGRLRQWNFSALMSIANETYDPTKQIHHNNGISFFNYIENLSSVTRTEHKVLHKDMNCIQRNKLIEYFLPNNSFDFDKLSEKEFSNMLYGFIKISIK